MLHPDAPLEVQGDVDAYAKWRVEHMDPEDIEATADMPLDDILAMFRDEMYEAMDSPEEIANENAEIELEIGIRNGTIRPN